MQEQLGILPLMRDFSPGGNLLLFRPAEDFGKVRSPQGDEIK